MADAIYINDSFDDDILTYDTPRKNQDDDSNDEEMDCIECDYDIPKVREAILTPIEEEETQEYDVPTNNAMIKVASEEQLYENQHYAAPRQTDLEPIYMNEMSMDFLGIAPGVDLSQLKVGDPIEFTFEVRWKSDPRSLVTKIVKLPPDTKLRLSGEGK